MAAVFFITQSGNTIKVKAEKGRSLMEVAVDNDVTGVVAECGGACACATCHVYVKEDWQDKLPAMDDMEDAMLDSAQDRKAGSRLSCQIEITPDLDGLTVTVADNES